jgi:uncharacterized membrane protein YoaK (UPF0700 family)
MDKETLGDLALATILMAIAGFVDAVGFLSLGGLFLSFASGNSTRFAVALGGVSAERAVLAGELVSLFVAGAFGGRVIAIAAGEWRRPAVLIAETVLLGAAWLLSLSGVRPFVLMALAMGAQNAVVHRAGRIRIATSFISGTLVQFGERLADALLAAGPAWAWAPYLILWIGLIAGGAAGGAAYAAFGIRSVAIPAGGALALAVVTGVRAWGRRGR